MLDIKLIRSAQKKLGLSQANLAKECGVSKEAVSNWLSGESIPRARKALALADALKLSLDEIFSIENDVSEEPVIAYRMRNNRAPSLEAQTAGEEIGRHLKQLLPLTGSNSVFSPRHLVNPSLDDDYVTKIASAIREQLGLTDIEPVTHGHLINLFHEFGAFLVPVFWGEDKDGHENAMSVYLPDSKSSWVLFNLGCRLDDFNYWLSHEFAHCLTLHTLQGDEGEKFAEKFAQALLFPEKITGEALAAIRNSKTPLKVAKSIANTHNVSVVTVIKAINKLAKSRNEAVPKLETPAFYAKWNSEKSTKPTVAKGLFGINNPSLEDAIRNSEKHFHTPIFRAIAKWQKIQGGRSPAFIASALNLDLNIAIEMSHVLWVLED
ncbi:helix-turn-helix transcriptional regulator [Polynucleobacter sp. Fuers-14]|uniref:helix-turn-helix transcriptional regulator n=1 Tax=Polynucleobacter sp. Fuers-14 TaxID=1758364 RepID=UPI001C0AFCEC|nr:helix-turn-helix transcriptional regulator [Polynucleobacter sp. Fuers-14]MBU3640817.1 helix-turn-helix transcriptional regulator [Polynucleobacter sp. Fuers-14]